MRVMLAAAASGLVLLSGCGVASTQFHPGLAAEVGDGSVTTDQVDQATSAFCRYIENDDELSQNAISLQVLRSSVAGQLTLVEAARQIARERDVSTGTDYEKAKSSAESDPNLKGLDDDEVDDIVDLNASNTYIGDIINGLGAQVAEERGTKLPAGAQAAAAVTSPLGKTELEDWIKSHDVEIDPRYDVQLDGTQATPTDESISFAEGSVARAGLALESASQPDAAVLAALPPSQRCGGDSAAPAAVASPSPR